MINPLSSAPLPNLTEASWLALGMSNQLGYIARDAVRVQAVPDHRKADTLARNFVPAFMIPLIMETAFRLVDTFYTMPLLSKVLKLPELGYNTMPESLRGRMVSRLVTPSSVFVVPRVLEKMDLPKATGEAKKELLQLTPHMQKMLCPTDYLETLVSKKRLTQQELEQIKAISTEFLKNINVEQMVGEGITAYHSSMDESLKQIGKKHLEQYSHEPSKQQELLKLAKMCIGSDFTREMVKRIQKSATWQNMLLATFMSFLFYGLMANLLEVKVVRPWQKRLVAERGTAAEVVAPCYMATIPWLLTVFVGLSDKAPRFLKKMSHLNRFLTVSGVAFTSFVATAGLLIKRKLSGPPPAQALQARQQAALANQKEASVNPQNSSAPANGMSFGIGAFQKPHSLSNQQSFPVTNNAPTPDMFQPAGNPYQVMSKTSPFMAQAVPIQPQQGNPVIAGMPSNVPLR